MNNLSFDTIVYCIVDAIYTVLDGINIVVSEANQKKIQV